MYFSAMLQCMIDKTQGLQNTESNSKLTERTQKNDFLWMKWHHILHELLILMPNGVVDQFCTVLFLSKIIFMRASRHDKTFFSSLRHITSLTIFKKKNYIKGSLNEKY